MYGDQKDLWTKQGDSRITPIGKWLRKFRIDEIPQSINFLLGNLSLVGPRPEQIGIVEQLKKDIPFCSCASSNISPVPAPRMDSAVLFSDPFPNRARHHSAAWR
jgi:hypothetical protein